MPGRIDIRDIRALTRAKSLQCESSAIEVKLVRPNVIVRVAIGRLQELYQLAKLARVVTFSH